MNKIPSMQDLRSGQTVDVSVIYVNWNCADEIEGSIASLREQVTGSSYEVIVVDNDSPQGPGALAHDASIRLIMSGKNGGFGAGCNIGAAAARGKYLLFLNPDTRLLNDVPTELMRFLDSHPLVGIAGSMVEDSQGEVSFDGGRSLALARQTNSCSTARCASGTRNSVGPPGLISRIGTIVRRVRLAPSLALA